MEAIRRHEVGRTVGDGGSEEELDNDTDGDLGVDKDEELSFPSTWAMFRSVAVGQGWVT